MNKVIYHANCPDGFCSAYLLHKFLGDDAEYIPMNYGTILNYDKFNDEDIIYIADFSFKRPVMIELASRVSQIWVFDHHKTAEQELKDLDITNLSVKFNIEKSGAQLTYDYLQGMNCKEYPILINYIADRDLWKFELPNSREISAYIRTIEYSFNEWNKLENLIYTQTKLICECGAAILKYQERQIENSVRNARDKQLLGTNYIVPAVNATVNFSEVAGELANGRDFGIVWFQRSDGKFQYSLRSTDTGIDVAELAKTFGGGGHRNAAGFESDMQVLI